MFLCHPVTTVTFPDDWMPLMTARQTRIQATSRDRVIFQFRPPVSSMLLVMFRVWRYQKYVVAELFSHSGSTTLVEEKERRNGRSFYRGNNTFTT